MSNGEDRTPQQQPGTERKIDTSIPAETPLGLPYPGRSQPVDRPGGGDDQGFGAGVADVPPTPKKSDE